ncbi:MAG: rRNA maturation RNase YbeY [Clostridia bacterium]
MKELVEITFDGIKENQKQIDTIKKVVRCCFEEEHLTNLNIYLSVTLTTPEKIKVINQKYRGIDKATDVLSFPMFEKEELEQMIAQGRSRVEDVLGDIIISIQKVEEQAKEYGHSFERELAYMVVHGFYHLMGYDHIQEKDKIIMRPKEEKILEKLKITREA